MLKPGTQLSATATCVRIHLSVIISHTPNNQNNKILIYLKKNHPLAVVMNRVISQYLILKYLGEKSFSGLSGNCYDYDIMISINVQ